MKKIIRWPVGKIRVTYIDMVDGVDIEISKESAMSQVKSGAAEIIEFADSDAAASIAANSYKDLRRIEYNKKSIREQLGMIYDMFKDSHGDSDWIKWQSEIKNNIIK